MSHDYPEEDVGPVGVLKIFVDPDDGQITFSVSAQGGDQIPAPINESYYTEEELKRMPVPYTLAIVALYLTNNYILEKVAGRRSRLAELGQGNGGTVH